MSYESFKFYIKKEYMTAYAVLSLAIRLTEASFDFFPAVQNPFHPVVLTLLLSAHLPEHLLYILEILH